MMGRKRILRGIAWVAATALVLLAARAAVVWSQSLQGPGSLAIRWEGAYHDLNERDWGASLNRCLGEPLFAEGRVTRAAQWFSGWSCEKVGEPDVILSLNYRPDKDERFYCRQDGHNLVGRVSGIGHELSDLEFLASWDDPETRASACWYLREGLQVVAAGQKLLFHCDAGRDRTGAYAALLAGMAAERAGKMGPAVLDAIECDYRKSRSLVAAKHGRMARFLTALQGKGGVNAFLQDMCGIDEGLRAAASRQLLAAPTGESAAAP